MFVGRKENVEEKGCKQEEKKKEKKKMHISFPKKKETLILEKKVGKEKNSSKQISGEPTFPMKIFFGKKSFFPS